MGLFDFLKRKKEPPRQEMVQLYNPVKGRVMPITEVSDPVFAEKMMGDGFGVEPETGAIYSPVTADVLSVFPTKHAIGLKLANGVDLLIHIGIDTVELDGAPFEVLVEKGELVGPETLLVQVDLDALEAANKEKTIIIAFTNMGIIEEYSLTQTGELDQGVAIGSVKAKV